MLKVTKDLIVRRNVDIYEPGDGNSRKHCKAHVSFKILPTSAIEEMTNAEMMKLALVGWDEAEIGKILEVEGKPIPFDEENRDAVLDVPYVFTALLDAYVAASRGAKAKN